MTTDYSYDPNSGAAPQPGGFASGGHIEPEVKEVELTDEQKDAAVTPTDPADADTTTTPVPTGDAGDAGDPTATKDNGDQQVSGEAYDPSKHGADEVKTYIAEHPDEKDAVLAAERAGKARKGLLNEA